MRLLSKTSFSFIVLILSACGLIAGYKPEKRGLNEGYDLKVWIDGKRSEPIDTPIFQGMNFFNQISGPGIWQINGDVSNRPQIKFEIDLEQIGKFKSAKVLIERAPSDETNFWDPYYSNLSTETPEFEPGYSVQLSHFQSANDLNYTETLPSGTYLFRLFAYGAKNWDTQTIFVKVN